VTPRPLTPAEREEWSERAAIIEYEAGLSRAEAERQAMACVEQKRYRAQLEALGVTVGGEPVEPVTRGRG